MLLVASAIYAPFLASDEPYYLRATDLRALRQSTQTLAPLATELREAAGSAAKVANARAAVVMRLETLLLHVDPAHELHHRTLAARRRVEQERDVGGASDATLEAITALARDSAAALADPRAPGLLRAASRWPLLERLELLDWLMALLAPVVGVALVGKLRLRGMLLALLLAAAAGATLAAVFEAPEAWLTRDLKAGLTRGDVVAESVVFAPVPYGYAETRLSEVLRPPTWLASAELDERGRYVRGPRAAPQATSRAVEIRAGEPSLNSPGRHWLGADSLGRDVLTRVLWGGRVSLAVAFGSVALLLALGVAAGLAAGVSRGAFDTLFLIVVQTLQSFPSLFLILVVAAVLPARGVHPQLATASVIALVGWTGVARLVRGEVRALREREWVLAARGSGLSPARVLWAHIAPNAVAPAIVSGAFALGGAVLAESATSFLGFGVQPPTPSWGAVLRESSAIEHLWILVCPGLAVFATVASANALGDALRKRLDLSEVGG